MGGAVLSMIIGAVPQIAFGKKKETEQIKGTHQ
jgi:hypothetical protein